MVKKLIDVELRASGAKREADSLSRKVKGIGTSADSTVKTLGRLSKGALAVAAAIAAAGAATVAMVKSSADANRELETMAKLVGITTTEFNALAFATNQYGVSAEQISDISKDVGEKVAEFAAAGTGAFQDYADVMKLSKDQAQAAALEFEKLSGDQVLRQVVKNLEAAGTSGGRVSFVLESLGNDATKLIPLLTRNSAELNRLTRGFSALNNQLKINAGESGDLKKVSENFDLLAGTAEQAKIAISASLAPAVSDLFTDITELIPPATKEIIAFINSFKDVEDIKDVTELESELKRVEEQLIRTTERVEKFGAIFGTADIDNAKVRIKELREQIQELQTATSKSQIFEGTGFANTDVAGEVDAAKAGAVGAPEKKREETPAEKAKRIAAEKAAKEAAQRAADSLAQLKANLTLETEALQRENAVRAEIRAGNINAEIAEESLRFTNKTVADQARFEQEIASMVLTEEQRKELRLQFQEQQLEEARLFEENLTSINKEQSDLRKQQDDDEADNRSRNMQNMLATGINLGASLLKNEIASNAKSEKEKKRARKKGVVIDTVAGIAKTFGDLGYPAGIPAALALAAQGVAGIATINSASGSPSVGGGGSASAINDAANSPPTTPTAQAQRVASRRVVDLRGLEGDQTVNLNRDQLIELLEGDDDVIVAASNGQSEAARLGVI